MAKTKAAPKPRKTRAKRIGEGPAGSRAELPFPIVAIGASAGGLAAFTALLRALPSKSGMAFVLIQHLEPSHESALTTLLSKARRMPVVEVSDGIPVEPNHVYVIPPNKNMTIHEGALRLVPRSNTSGLQRPIDDFSIALAEEQGIRQPLSLCASPKEALAIQFSGVSVPEFRRCHTATLARTQQW